MEPTIDYRQLAAALIQESAGAGVRTKGVVSSTPQTTWGHGNGGLFSYPGLSRPVFNAMGLPKLGLQSMLPVRKSMDENPLYGIFTGVTATTGSEPTGICDDPPVAGLSKLCTQTQVFARMSRMTPVIDITRVGRVTNRGEFTDLQFIGDPTKKNPNSPSVPGGAGGLSGVLNTEMGKTLFEYAVAWARDFAGDIYTGNPTNNTAGGGRKYFHGLDTLINTGHRDAITLQACPAADSIVRDFASADVSAGDPAATNIVKQITNIYRNLKKVAVMSGLMPVKWTIVMRWTLFYELSAVWPCAYQTYRCATTGTNDRTVTDRNFLNAMTEGMRGDMDNMTGQYLLIDGEKVAVTLDDGIAETVLAGESFTSTIYFVPLTVVGGTEVTLMEHINYDAPNGAMEAARLFAPDGFYNTSDGGRFIWHKKLPNNFCVQLLAATEPRLLLLTPHLAARLNNVKYTPLAHEREWDTASSYFVNGGRTNYQGYGPSLGSPTA